MFWFVSGCITLGGALFALGFAAGRRESQHWDFTRQLLAAYVNLARTPDRDLAEAQIHEFTMDKMTGELASKPWGVD